ncbi:MAG: hypothetical protein A3F78_11765 [Burkholderiales bacterium RIFCSPLOWO2_12_FULL_61_40]|nr:MAG: hypothetical protein A3F78_11765 [Burkholderiales bacterium RIFCSPLOWO2_12_FULL_61_40]
MPQKVSQVDTLPVSWPIVSIAAEILNSWPTGISSFLKRLHAQGCVDQKGKLPKAFGGFYSALYRGFKEVEFDFLRTAFENYVAEHWAGAIGKRNRRLDIRVLNSLAWIPANHACQILGVSRRRLNGLIEKERLQADRRITAGNRIFIVVKRSEVQNLALTLDDGVPLSDVARRLGFKKQRLLSLLPIICPQAEKLGEQGCPWAIPITWLEGWEAQIQSYTCVALVDSESVSLGHLLRYWPWTDGQIGHLLTDILNSKIVPVGRLESINGIGSLILETSQLKTWFSGKQKVPCSELTIPEVSLRIGVKQEVAYALVRIGLLQTAMRKIGRRTEQRVPTDALKNFERQYVFGRDIAQTLGRSSRSITAFLASEGVEPIAGPAINKCRQILFERDSVSRCLFRNGLTAVELVAPLPVTGEGR